MRLIAFVLLAAYYIYVVAMAAMAPRPEGAAMRVVIAFLFGSLFPLYVRSLRVMLMRDTVSVRGRTVAVRRRDRWIFALLLIGVSAPALELFLQARIRDGGIHGYHPFLQNLPVPGDSNLHINSLGLRAEEAEQEKPAGTFRIVFLGGSTVFAAEVPFEKSHPRLVELALRDAYPERRIEVLNAGVPWHSSQHSLLRYTQQVQALKPDLIVVWHAINDLWRSFSPRRFASGPFRPDYAHYLGPVTRLVFRHFGRPIEPFVTTGLHTIDVPINQLAYRARRDLTESTPRDTNDFPSLPSFRSNMRYLVRLIRSDGIPVLLASQPSLYRTDLPEAAKAILTEALSQTDDGTTYASLATMTRGMEQFNRTTEQLATELGVSFVDLANRVPKDPKYFVDDVHYTEAGNQAVAESIKAAIVGMSLLRQ